MSFLIRCCLTLIFLCFFSDQVEEVRAWKDELLQQRKGTIQKKMAKAEERRQLQMKIKAQKAHEEEAKVE